MIAKRKAASGAIFVFMPHGGDRRSDQAANLPLGPTQAEAAAAAKVANLKVGNPSFNSANLRNSEPRVSQADAAAMTLKMAFLSVTTFLDV